MSDQSQHDQTAEAAKSLSAAMTKAEEHAQEIAVGSDLEGIAGAVWRLLGRCDYREVEGWIKSEVIRGTPMVTIMDTLSAMIAATTLQMAGRVNRTQMRQCARDIMTKAAELLERDLQELAAAKKTDTILRNNLRIVPGQPGA